MIDLHYWPTPNGHKITIFLEEANLPYTIHKVNIGTGEQFKPEFLAIAPNNRMPAIVDHTPKDVASRSVFLNQAPSCNISPKRRVSFYPATSVLKLKPCNGYSGKWAALGRWRDRTTTSIITHPKKSPMRWNAIPRKPTGFTEC